jgi:glycosyltransferase involved in cell wall biosynthesis
MGAGRVVRDGVEGLVIDPLDVDDLARAMTLLADDVELRGKLGRQAAERALEFEWSKVGPRLYEHFRDVASRAN